MAISLTTLPQINAYVAKVISEAQHHAAPVAAVIPPLAAAVIARLNLAIDDVSIYQRNGKLARTCWVTFGGTPSRRWVFSYNYAQQKIDLRQHSVQGPTVFQFDNSTSAAAIAAQVASL
jgi:hypothetical protein